MSDHEYARYVMLCINFLAYFCSEQGCYLRLKRHQNKVQLTGYNLKINVRVKGNIARTSGKIFSVCVPYLDGVWKWQGKVPCD
jgi:hypothetical protein